MDRQENGPAVSEHEWLLKQYREQLSEYKTVNAELADLAWTLAELEQQIAGLRDEIAVQSGEQPEARLRDLQRWHEGLEERVLRQMFRAEALAQEVAELRRSLSTQAKLDSE